MNVIPFVKQRLFLFDFYTEMRNKHPLLMTTQMMLTLFFDIKRSVPMIYSIFQKEKSKIFSLKKFAFTKISCSNKYSTHLNQ